MKNIIRNSSPVFSLVFWGLILSSFQALKLPLTNQRVIEFCELNLNKKVGRGQCWDLAQAALEYANADWNPPYNFGEEIEAKTIIAGDIIQIENLRIESPNGNWSEFPHHTAIVYKVLDNESIIIVHQNFGRIKRVKKFQLDMQHITKGSIKFYRPKER